MLFVFIGTFLMERWTQITALNFF